MGESDEKQADIDRFDIPKGVKKAVKDGPLDASELVEDGREGHAGPGSGVTKHSENHPQS
jgi:hypothetical protein